MEAPELFNSNDTVELVENTVDPAGFMNRIPGREEVLRVQAKPEACGVVDGVSHHAQLLERAPDRVSGARGVFEVDGALAGGGVQGEADAIANR